MAHVEEFIAALLSRPTTVLLAAALLLLLLLLHLLYVLYVASTAFSSKESREYPPGPKPLPLVGNFLQLDLGRPYKSLYELSKKYGSVFTVYLGPKKVVVLSGYKAVRAAVVGYERRNSPVFKDLNPLGHGLVFANTLKNFGMPRNLAEDKILLECGYLIEMFERHQGNPFDTTRLVNYAVSNVIASIVYGQRFEYGDPRFTIVVWGVTQMTFFTCSATVQFYNMFPRTFRWIRHAMVKNGEIDVTDSKDFVEYLKKTWNPAVSRGFVDYFLIWQQEEQTMGVSNGLYSDENLVSLVGDLFTTGTETSASLRWALLFMAKYPQIQDRVQEELDRVLGSDCISVADQRNLPFTNAVIHETQRIVNILPKAVPYQTSRDITFQGYFIKKGTTVFSLLTSVLYDDSEWESPYTFNPAHFLNEEGDFIQRRALAIFSRGCKVYLGGSLVRMELFLFFTSLLQRFRFAAPPGVSEDQLDVTPVVGAPPPQQLCAIDRWM